MPKFRMSGFGGSAVAILTCATGVAAAAGAVPPDPHELVTGAVQVVYTPAEHAATLYLLERARQNSLTHNRGMEPYHFTATFNAVGSADESGAGEVTEIWMSGQKWRWTANLGSASVVRISNQGRVGENVHVATIPMRAHMLRNEIFWAIDEYASKAQLRTAQVQWNGKPATCILASGMTGAITQTQGRLWQEEEYCVDNGSGLLVLHSIAPGTFAVFGYTANQQFHGRTMPDRISIYVGGSLAADSSFSIVDATSGDQETIVSGSQTMSDDRVVGVQMPIRIPIAAPPGASVITAGGQQSVMVHANVDGEGRVLEAELSATGDPSLTQAALDLVKARGFGPSGTQRQMYLNVIFGQ